VAPQRATGNIKVDGFGVTIDADARRLDFPHAGIDALRGEAGAIEYRAREVVFEALRASLQRVQWSTDAASAGDFVVRDKQGRFELKIARVELPHGVMLAPGRRRWRRAGRAPRVAGRHAAQAARPRRVPPAGFERSRRRRPPPPLRQQRLRFLDAVNGELAFRLKVVLDLPVVGIRTLDQQVKVAIKDGAFDYRALESGLSWLEGQFVDVGIDDGRFVVGWSVPLMATKEIISWALDPEAMVVGIFNRVPLRCLADFRIPRRRRRQEGRRPRQPPHAALVGDLGHRDQAVDGGAAPRRRRRRHAAVSAATTPPASSTCSWAAGCATRPARARCRRRSASST
jgi:hypothetical protein